MLDRIKIGEIAKAYGFCDFGICSIEAFEEQKQVIDSQPWLKERDHLKFSPMQDYPWASSLIVLLWSYAPASLPSEDEVFVDSYYLASNRAYHAAADFAAHLQKEGYHAQANVSYPARTAALRAGLGITGHNGMVIHPKYGSRVVIILVATDAAESLVDHTETSECLRCGRCVTACPTGAIDRNGMCHPERCLRNFMMEGCVVPEETREKFGMKLIGCDVCQRVCPMQPRIASEEGQLFTLDAFMTLDTHEFRSKLDALSELIGRNVARPQRVRAQLALLAGNRKKPSYVPILKEWANSPHDAVREHAIWALSKIEENQLTLDQT